MKKLTLILLLTLAPTSQAFASEKNKTNPKFFWGAAIAAPSLIIAIGFGTYTIITIKSIEVIEKRINNIQNETVRNALIQDLKSLETQLKIGAIGTGISTLTTLIGLGIIGYGFYENYQEKQVMIANHEKFIDQMEKEYEKFQNSGTKKQVDALKKEKHNREVSLIIWEKAWERGKKRREQFLNRKKIYDKWEKSKNKKMFLQDILGEQLFTLLGGDLIEPKKPQDVLESFKITLRRAPQEIFKREKKLKRTKIEFAKLKKTIDEVDLIEEKYKNFHEIRDEKTKSSKIDKIVKEQARVEELNSLINDFLS